MGEKFIVHYRYLTRDLEKEKEVSKNRMNIILYAR